MITHSEEQLQSLVQKAEEQEQSARRRAALYSLIPIVLAGLLILFTGWQIRQANQELAMVNVKLQTSQQQLVSVNEQLVETQEQLNHSQQELTATQKQLNEAKQEAEQYRQEADELRKQLNELEGYLDEVTMQLRLATEFEQYAFTGDWLLSTKHVCNNVGWADPECNLVQQLWELRDTQWRLGGYSPVSGFDSPSFAAYVLGQSGFLNDTVSPYDLRYELPEVPFPSDGDLVFYVGGYTMFYFRDERGEPFVIGMTPLGVLALKPDFAQELQYGKVFRR